MDIFGRPNVWPHYRFSAKEIARFSCIGCGVNVIKAGDFCMVDPKIWKDQLHLEWTDNLCIACIETRMERKLLANEFLVPFPTVEGFEPSDAIQDGAGFNPRAVYQKLCKQSQLKSKRRAKRRLALKLAA